MTGVDFNIAMAEAGMTNAQLALLAGVDRSTIWRWRSGNQPVPAYAWTILRLHREVEALSSVNRNVNHNQENHP